MEINIGLYTNEKDKIEYISVLINKVMLYGKYKIKLYSFINKEAFSESFTNPNMKFDIVVLNDENDGTKLGREYRKHNRNGIIIYLSSDKEAVWDSLRSMPVAYIINTNDIKEFASALLYSALWVNKGKTIFKYKTKDCVYSIPLNEIDFFESNYRIVKIHQNNGLEDREITAKLDDIEKYLPDNMFYRCHQSYCVNMNNIKILDKATKVVHFKSGSNVFISKSHYTDFVKYFEEYIWNA